MRALTFDFTVVRQVVVLVERETRASRARLRDDLADGAGRDLGQA